MTAEKYRLLKGKIRNVVKFKPRRQVMASKPLPRRDRQKHQRKLLKSLKEAENKALAQSKSKVKGVTHSIFAVKVAKDTDVAVSSFGDKRECICFI